MSIYSGKHATAQITATDGTILQVAKRVKGLGHRIFLANISLYMLSFMIEQFAIRGTQCHTLVVT
jgi:hypothetical protein